MANESSNATAALSLGVDTNEAVQNTRLLVAELEKLKAVSASLGNAPVTNNATVQSLKTARAEAEALSRDLGTTTSNAGRTAGEKFSASFSQTLGDGVRVTFRKAGADAIAMAREVSGVLSTTQNNIRAEYGRTAIEQARMEKADLEAWKARTALANQAAAEILAAERRLQAQREELDELAHAKRVAAYQEQVALARRTQAQIEAIDEAAYAKRVAQYEAEMAAKAAVNNQLMGKGGIGNRLLTGTSSDDLAQLQRLGAEYARMEKESAKLGDTTKRLSPVQREVNSLFKDSAGVMGDAHAAARGLSGALGQLWVTYGAIAPLVAFAALGASMRETYTAGKELEYQLKFVSVVAEGAAVNTEQFYNAVTRSMSTASDAAEGLRMLAQSGLTVQEAMAVLPTTLNLATIGEVSVKEAAEAATGAMQAFSLEITDFERIGDVFAKASALSNASVSSIMESMRQASTVADFYNITIEQTAASLATMAKANIVGSAAGTALRNAMKELYTPTEKAKQALTDVGIEVFDANGKMGDYTSTIEKLRGVTSKMSESSKLTFLNDVFGERGAKAINQILSNYSTYSQILKELNESSGFVNRGVSELQDTVEGASIRMKNALNESVVGAFDDAKDSIRDTVEAIGDGFATPEFQEALKNLAILTANFTQALVENADVIITLLEIYLGARGLAYVSTSFGLLTRSANAFVEGQKAAKVAAEAAMAAQSLQTVGMTAQATAMGRAAEVTGSFARGITLASRALGFLGIGITAATVAYEMYTLWQSNATESADGFTKQSASVLTALERENKRLDENIRLLKEKAGLQETAEKQTVRSTINEAFKREAEAREKLERVSNSKLGGSASQNVAEIEAARKELADATNIRKQITEAEGRRQLKEAEYTDLNKRSSLNRELDNLLETASNGTAQAKKYVDVVKQIKADMNAGKKELTDVEGQIKIARNLINAAQDNSYKGQTRDKGASEERRQAEADLDAIKKRWDDVNQEEQRGFNNYKQMLDQRAGSGALDRGAASVMIEAKAAELKVQLDANTKSELAELDAYERSHKNLKESARTRLDTLRASIQAEQRVRAQSAAQVTALRIQAQKDEETADARNLAKTIAKAEEQARLKNEKTERSFNNRYNTDTVALAGQAAFEASFTSNASAVQKYADEVTNAKTTLADLLDGQNVSTEAIEAQTRAVNLAEERYRAMLDVQKSLAEQSRELAEAQQTVANSFEDGAQRAIANYIRNVGTAADQTERLFTKAFNGATDALVNFTKTGKLDFKSFASSLIEEMIRIETQRMLTGILSGNWGSASNGAFIPGLIDSGVGGGGALGSLFSGGGDFFSDIIGSAPLGSAGTGDGILGFFSTLFSAKGNAFGPNDVHPFAKGSAFTNSVVSEPTFFKFAKGGKFGVMGEAGDEAVMPLQRDSQGRLGVISMGGGNTSNGATVINNNISVTVQGGKDADETGEIVSNKVVDMMRKVADQQIANSTRLNGMLNKVAG